MEYIVVAIILFMIGRGVFEMLPTFSFKKIFLIASVVLLVWVIIQETSKWGIFFAIGGTIVKCMEICKMGYE